MGQQISSTNLNTLDLFITNNENFDKVLSDDRIEDVHLFLPLQTIDTISKNSIASHEPKNSIELPITKQTVIKHIRTHLSLLTTSPGLDRLNTEMATIIQQVFDSISTTNTNLQSALQAVNDKQKQLKDSLAKKLKDDENATASIFAEQFIESSNSNETSNNNSTNQTELNQFRAQQLSFFAVQSLISMLLMLVKSMQKYDATMVHQMLILTNQLVELIPLNYLSPDVYKKSSNLFKSLRPLTNYITELSLQTDIDPLASQQSIKILLNFSIIKSSFKDILPIIKKLIFNKNDIYDIRTLLIELNKNITTMMEQFNKDKQTPIATENTVSADEVPKESEKPGKRKCQ